MRSPSSDIRGVLSALLVAVLFSCCSKGPSEQQKQADTVLSEAKSAISRGAYREAQTLLGQASDLDEALGRKGKVAEELRLIGFVLKATASFDSALIFYNRAIEEYRNVADRDAVRDVTLEIASIVRLGGEERKAYGIYVEALRLARVFNDSEGIRDIAWAMLPTCRALGEREEERRILAELLRDYAGRKDSRGQARVHFAAGLSSFSAGNNDSAARSFQHAFTFAESAKDSLMPLKALLRLAMAEGAAGDLKGSFQAYGDAIRRSERVRGAQPIRAELFTRVGNAYVRDKRPADATRFYRAALQAAMNTGNKLAEGYIALQLGYCDLETNPDAAVKSFRSAFELLRSLGHAPGMVYALGCLGIAAQRSGQFTEAYKNLKAAADLSLTIAAQREHDDLYRECEETLFGLSRFPAHDEIIELLLQAGKFEEAFSYVERRDVALLRKGLNAFAPAPLEESLAGALTRYSDERTQHIRTEQLLDDLLQSGVPQKEQLAAIRAALDASTRRMSETAEAVVRLNKAYEPVVEVNAVGLGTIQKNLAPGVAFVEFVPTRRAMYAFVVTAATSSVQMAAVTGDSLASRCREFLMLLRRRELRMDTTQLRTMQVDQRLRELTGQLFGSFIRPIEGELANVTKVIAVFSGELPTVPLHALRRGMLPGTPFVGEQHLVTYLPTAGSLLLSTPALTTVREVIGVGYPGQTEWDVEYELRDIRAFYKDARLFFNQQASLPTLQNEKADLLHLAAEFRFDTRTLANSFVTLSEGKSVGTARRLPLGELFSIAQFPSVVVSDLAADHVWTVPAEAYIYFAGGTAALIANAYTPSRKTKKIFGELFYTALLQGNTTPAAYWKTELEMMKNREYAGQYTWGVFFLWGR